MVYNNKDNNMCLSPQTAILLYLSMLRESVFKSTIPPHILLNVL